MRQRYTLGGPTVTRAEGIVLIVIFALSIAFTAFGSSKQRRFILLLGGFVFAVSTAIALLRITGMALYEPEKIDAVRLLKTALFIWLGNIISFSVIYDLLGLLVRFVHHGDGVQSDRHAAPDDARSHAHDGRIQRLPPDDRDRRGARAQHALKRPERAFEEEKPGSPMADSQARERRRRKSLDQRMRGPERRHARSLYCKVLCKGCSPL
jgi:hypothetical protein